MSRDLAGRVVGAFRLGEIAGWGKGPSATVYESEHAASGNKVAVKIYSADFAKDKNVAARLVAEVQRATQVKHPHLTEVLDVGTTEHKGKRHVYVATEWLKGETLQSRLSVRKGPLPLPLVLQVASDIGAALQALHKQGGAHRALSAASIFLASTDGEEGEVTAKLMDLGAAQVEAQASGEALPKGDVAAAEDIKTLARIVREALSKPDGQGPLRAQNPGLPVRIEHALATALGEQGEGYSNPASFVAALLGAGSLPSVGPWSSDGVSMPLPPRTGIGMGWIVGSLAVAGGVALWLTHREPQGPTPALGDLASVVSAADLATPPPTPVDQATPAKAVDAAAASTKADAAAPAADLQPRSRDGSRDLATPVKVETPPEVARKPRPRRTGPPIPPVRGPLDWNPNLNFQAPPPPVVAPPVAAAPKEPVQAESKPKRPKRTGPPIPPLRP